MTCYVLISDRMFMNTTSGSFMVAEWKKAAPSDSLDSLYIMSICCLSYFRFWSPRQDFGSDCAASSWSLLPKACYSLW